MMYRCSSRATAGVNNRYSSTEYVLASFMKGEKHAVIPLSAININPINMEQGQIKICGNTTPLDIVSKGTKAQMHMDKTRFARETGSEEVDLGLFMDDDDEEKENDVYEDFDTPTPAMQTLATSQRSTVSKENPMNKSSDVHSSSRSSTTHVMKEKLDFDTVYNPSSSSKKRKQDLDSSLDGSDGMDEAEEESAIQIVSKKRTDINDSNDMLNKMLNRKRAPGKKRKKITTPAPELPTADSDHYRHLEERMDYISQRLDRVERVIPIVKTFYSKQIGLEAPTSTTTTACPTTIQQINRSIKEIFGVEASEVKGSRERPTIVIRSLFTKSNHITDYREYLDKHAAILQNFLQYRCPGIINMDQTWQEVIKSMASLPNDMKKNSKTKLAWQMANGPSNQQQLTATTAVNNPQIAPTDNVAED